jgi:hypothetical protein
MFYLPLCVTQVSSPAKLPVTSHYNYADTCLRFLPPSDIYCVLVGANCKVLKTHNYGSRREELKLECEANNSISL